MLENVCRALIVQNEQNNAVDIEEVRQVPLLDGGQGSNLALMLIHRTRAGKLLTLFSNEPQLPGANRLPHTALHLEGKVYFSDFAFLFIFFFFALFFIILLYYNVE